MPQSSPSFHATGTATGKIDVEISYQIIGLFSEGLYSSPNKAIEELVSNAFDADATRVHVLLSPDRAAPDATIAVFDNGTGMDDLGLRKHWIVGDSVKTRERTTARGRRTIGRFGIGKLAAYVLGNRLTHITKAGGKYYSTSMDFSSIPQTVDVEKTTANRRQRPKPVQLDLRELTQAEAKAALKPWLTDANGLDGLVLFGSGAASTWTAAIISELKSMATELSSARLRWVLSTAMPLRDDFSLHLGGQQVASSKMDVKRVGYWILGKDIIKPPKPGPQEMEAGTDPSVAKSNYTHWTLTDSILGPISGYVEGYENAIDGGKSSELGRSNGFFVYVHGRLINVDDAGFGIDRNLLRHGTFSRFRVVINIDRLDEELRSSREGLRDGPRLVRARELLQALFNFVRSKIETHDKDMSTERQASQRLADSPLSLTERPIVSMLLATFAGATNSRHLVAVDRDQFADADELQAFVEKRVESGGGIVQEIAYTSLGPQFPIAMLDVVSGELSINLEHPYVANFADEFGDRRRNLPLQLFAMAEILLEAQLHEAGIDAAAMKHVLDARDELLRHLARSAGVQNSLTVAQDLINSASSAKGLEEALVLAFNQLGYDAVPKAGKDEADGIAEAFLSATADGVGHYRVSLEAKSKETVGAKVKKKDVEVSTIARHREEANCAHAIVVGPDFETGPTNLGAVIREIDADRLNYQASGKTITLMRISDLARLVRIAPVKRLNLEQMRELFQARTPDEAAEFVDRVSGLKVKKAPFKVILEMVWKIQQDDREHTVEYAALRTALRISGKLDINDHDLRNECAALSHMAENQFFARDDRVELNIHPDRVLEIIHEYVETAPKENES